MVQPVNALTPKVLFKGQVGDSKEEKIKRFRRNIAIADAVGVSAVTAAVTMAVSRSYTSSWQGAGGIGLGAGAILLAVLTPHYLKKAGINTKYSKAGDSFTKETVQKKILNEALDNTKNLESHSKNLLKKAV